MTRWKWTLLACCASLTLTAAEFTPDGVIEGKSGKIMIDQRNRFDFLDNGGSIAAFLSGSNPEGKWFSTGDLKEVKRSLDPAKRSVTVTGVYPATGKSPAIPVEYSLALLPDGHTARVSIAFQSEAVRQGFNLYFAFRFGYRDFMKERHVLFDGKEVNCAFDRAQRQRVPFYNGKAKDCVFNLPEDNSLLKFTLVNGDHAELVQDWNKGSKTHDSLDFVLGFPKDGKLVFDLDLDSLPEQAANSYRVGEMEFGPNKFRLPDYTLCRNLVQNPSFEDGLYFWADRPTGSAKDVAMPREYPFVVDETTAAHGKRSCRQLLAPGLISYLATFAIPVKAKTKYTLSFYAKTDAKTTFDLNLSGWTQARGPYLSEGGFCSVTKDWKRYFKTFTTPNKLAQIALMHNYGGPAPAYLWIDAVQLEEGAKATDFTMNPVSAVFETYSPMNLFQPGDVMLPRFPRRLGASRRRRDLLPRQGYLQADRQGREN